MEIKEYKIIPFSLVLLVFILPSWFDYGTWIKTFISLDGVVFPVPYINFYVEDITDEFIKMFYVYMLYYFIHSKEIKNFLVTMYFYYLINCFVVFTDYTPINGSYDLFDNYWKILKGIIFIIGIFNFYRAVKIKYNALTNDFKFN